MANKCYVMLCYVMLIADLQQNNLKYYVDCLQSLLFQNSLYLGLFYNKFGFMSLNKDLMLQNLEMLILQGNPLHKILLNVFEHGSKLQLTDISHVNLYSNFLNKV